MNKNKQYWLDRAIKKDKLLQKSIKVIEKELKKAYKNSIKEIKKELAYLYSQDDLTDFQKYRAEETIKSLESILDTMYKKEEELLENHLINVYKDIFKTETDYLEVNTAFNKVNEKLIEEIVKTNWSGLTFSERIWGNGRDKLVLKLKETLTKGLIRGDSLQDMARLVANELDKDYKRALSLVHTETCWIQNEATINSYKEADLEEYEYLAFLDERTTPQCRELDGKVFKLKEAQTGVNLPPMHVRCRSCVMPVID